jgi:hypothetical protein
VKRLLRATSNLLAATSGLLFVATVMAWVISYRCYEGVSWNRPDCLIALRCSTGLVWFDCERADGPLWSDDQGDFMGVHPVFHVPAKEEYTDPPFVKSNRPWGNFRFGRFSLLVSDRRSENWASATYLVTMPAWSLALTWILPMAWYSLRWRRAANRGCCAACGYDLRATPDRCPECGRSDADKRLKTGRKPDNPEKKTEGR